MKKSPKRLTNEDVDKLFDNWWNIRDMLRDELCARQRERDRKNQDERERQQRVEQMRYEEFALKLANAGVKTKIPTFIEWKGVLCR